MQSTGGKVRLITKIVKNNNQEHKYKYWEADCGNINGKRIRKTFKNKIDAERFLKRKQMARTQLSNAALSLSTTQMEDAARGLKLLKNTCSITTACKFYMSKKYPSGHQMTVKEAVELYINDKEKQNLRADYLKSLKYRVNKFKDVHLDNLMHEIESEDIVKWLDKNNYCKTNRKNYLLALSGLFNWAITKRLIKENPASSKLIPRPKADEKEVDIFSVEDTIKLLNEASNQGGCMIPYLSLGIFAGIRPTGIGRLEWSDINLKNKTIRISGLKAKTRSNRTVDISNNLLLWLKMTDANKRIGKIYYSRDALEKIRNIAGVNWASDICRHTFGSFYIAKYQDEKKTALQMGNTPDVVFKHYRNADISKEDIKKFWKISPLK